MSKRETELWLAEQFKRLRGDALLGSDAYTAAHESVYGKGPIRCNPDGSYVYEPSPDEEEQSWIAYTKSLSTGS